MAHASRLGQNQENVQLQHSFAVAGEILPYGCGWILMPLRVKCDYTVCVTLASYTCEHHHGWHIQAAWAKNKNKSIISHCTPHVKSVQITQHTVFCPIPWCCAVSQCIQQSRVWLIDITQLHKLGTNYNNWPQQRPLVCWDMDSQTYIHHKLGHARLRCLFARL